MVKMGSQNVYTVIGQLVQPVYTRSYNDFELCLTENSQKRFEANFTLKLTSSFNFTMDLDQAMFSNFQFAVTDVEIEDLELGAMPKEAQKFITSLADSLEFTASDFVINFFNSLTLQLKSSRITLPFSALINLPPGSFTDADANIENFMTKNKMSLTTCSIDLLKGFEVEPISPSRPAVGAATTTIPTTSTTGRPRLTGPPVLARELDQPFELKEPIKAFRQDPEPETELSFDEFRTDHQSDYQKSKKQSYNNNIDSVKSFWSNGQFVPPQ